MRTRSITIGILFVLGVGCKGSGPRAQETRRDPEAHVPDLRVMPRVEPPSSTAVDSGTVSAGACANATGEPRSPEIECVFKRIVRCVPPFPVRSAWQHDFPDCPMVPPQEPNWRFSACETRAKRLKGEQGCCYVEHERGACD